ncbi:hypothetical protein BELL_0556g00020 [Botrytis elliptica]|uniref:Uncharacterized protein n=1 Tax=Botrytis elliptica TaxID=278938 RepID=A0A4Z1JQL5_9HELO|nr:hypothetical protein BELL_0556g00020 [Botrytis elliptica]
MERHKPLHDGLRESMRRISRSKWLVEIPISEIQRGKAQDQNGEEIHRAHVPTFPTIKPYNIEKDNSKLVI